MKKEKRDMKEWAKYLPKDIRVKYLNNVCSLYSSGRSLNYNLGDAINYGFDWSMTNEKHQYWSNICSRARAGEFDTIQSNNNILLLLT